MDELTPLQRFAALEDDTPYYAALGRFVTYYAVAEAAVHMLARKLSGLSDERARIMISGLRLGDVQSKVKALLKISNQDAASRLIIEKCFTQLDAIATNRDKLVHRLVSVKEGTLNVTNIFTSKSLLTHENESFTVHDINCMQADCMIIYARLERVRQPSLAKADTPEFAQAIASPWFYKPQRQETVGKRRGQSDRSRRPQPQSSEK
ncbi:hypothetical protein WHZ78_31505 [Bradyrhizobium symbiodeficiens]|uniref:hypothetical protein n=1 Tax=Bradyrhizobium symbiodeficiens TaxID=1404367 RepID=UPI0030CF116C